MRGETYRQILAQRYVVLTECIGDRLLILLYIGVDLAERAEHAKLVGVRTALLGEHRAELIGANGRRLAYCFVIPKVASEER